MCLAFVHQALLSAEYGQPIRGGCGLSGRQSGAGRTKVSYLEHSGILLRSLSASVLDV